MQRGWHGPPRETSHGTQVGGRMRSALLLWTTGRGGGDWLPPVRGPVGGLPGAERAQEVRLLHPSAQAQVPHVQCGEQSLPPSAHWTSARSWGPAEREPRVVGAEGGARQGPGEDGRPYVGTGQCPLCCGCRCTIKWRSCGFKLFCSCHTPLKPLPLHPLLPIKAPGCSLLSKENVTPQCRAKRRPLVPDFKGPQLSLLAHGVACSLGGRESLADRSPGTVGKMPRGPASRGKPEPREATDSPGSCGSES